MIGLLVVAALLSRIAIDTLSMIIVYLPERFPWNIFFVRVALLTAIYGSAALVASYWRELAVWQKGALIGMAAQPILISISQVQVPGNLYLSYLFSPLEVIYQLWMISARLAPLKRWELVAMLPLLSALYALALGAIIGKCIGERFCKASPASGKES